MRVALIATAAFDYCVEYAELLTESCEVLFCAPEKSLASRAFIDPGVEIAPLHWPRHRSPTNLILIAKLLARIKAWRPDIVHFLGENNIWLNLLPPLIGHVPIVVTVHDIEYHPGDSENRAACQEFLSTGSSARPMLSSCTESPFGRRLSQSCPCGPALCSSSRIRPPPTTRVLRWAKKWRGRRMDSSALSSSDGSTSTRG